MENQTAVTMLNSVKTGPSSPVLSGRVVSLRKVNALHSETETPFSAFLRKRRLLDNNVTTGSVKRMNVVKATSAKNVGEWVLGRMKGTESIELGDRILITFGMKS